MGLLSAAGTKIVGRGFFCSSLWPSLGQVTCTGQPPHRRGRVSPDKRVPPLPWWRSHPTSTSQPGWGGWVVGSGGKRSTPQVLFFSAALLNRANFGKTRSRRPNTGVSVFSPSMRHLRGTRVAISGTRVRNPHFLLFHVFLQVFMKKHTSPRARGADPAPTMVTPALNTHNRTQVDILRHVCS